MNKRPVSVTVVSWIFIAIGAITLVYGFTQMQGYHFHSDDLWAALVRAAAIVCGVFLLRGSNWARWLAVAWMVFHIVLSALHSWFELAVHGLLFSVIAYFLFRASVSRYFSEPAS